MDRTIAPAIRPFQPVVWVAPEKQILTNGVPLHIVRAGSEAVCRLDILIAAGQWVQQLPLQALFTNRMLREGSVQYAAAEIAQRLDYYGAWLDISTSMTYSFVTLYSLNKYFAETLQVVRSILTEPTFPERELGLVLEKNKQLFAVNSNKVENLARRALNTTLFGTAHPCGRFAEAADYDRITAETLRQYHRRYYHAHNCTLYLSGCVTDEIVAQVTDQLGSDYWGNGAEEALLLPAVPQTEKEKRITIPRADAVQNSINMGMLTVDSAHADFHKLRILITLFGGYFGSRLSSNIREEKGYTYGIGAQFVAYPNCNLLRIATEAAPDYTEAIIREVYHEIDRLHSELIPEDELHKVCQYMLGESSRSYEGPFSLADAFVHLQVMNLPHTYLQDAQQALFQTTSQELRRLAQQYLQPSYLKEVVAGSV